MNQLKMVFQYQKLDRDPSLEQIPIGRYGNVVDGVHLPSCMKDDIRGFSLHPSYSAKDLRRIERIVKKNADRESRYSMSLRYNPHNFPSVDNLLIAGQTKQGFDGYIHGVKT